ncbi:MAG: hypothetical protein OEW08_06270, partial [Gammaproteobacteria bacterium]|nr:hypothetical protein [Gammaproteobacteria bacterium]
MRADNANFSAQNSAKAKAPRIVVQIAFNTASTDLYYLTSHADAALPAGAVATLSCVKGVSGTSQRLNPDQARAEIGAFNIDVTDKGRAITTLMFAKLGAGDGLKGKRVRVYVGYQGLAWAEYVLVGTQIVQGIAYDRGLYTFSCADVLRETRKDIFDLKTTKITATITATMDVIAVISTTGFETVAHGVSYSDAPSATVGYLRIDDEIIRYTGKTANTFTGCVRGALNTLAVDHVVSAGASNDRLPTVSEYVYLEMPAPKLALALLTGSLYGQASNLPANWHLGINAAYVRTADFTAIGADWWDAANDLAGLPVRFEGLQKTDGKKFIEEQLYLLLGAFSPVYADGSLGLRRMTKVLASSGYVAHLTASDIVSASALTHDLAAVINQVDIAWNWNAVQKRFTRRNTLIDAQSISTHGLAAPKKLEMRGLHGSIHSYTTLQSRFDSLRDRYAGPPERLRVQALHKWNTLEVGDTVRVTLDQVRDFPTGANLDRTFEVQSAQPDWVTGQVWLDLFGSSQPAGTVAWGGPAPVLANSYYTSAGTPLTSILTISVTGGVGHVTANGNLNGSATTSGAIYYYDGDLTIDTGKLITFTNNVQLRVKGHLTINGTLDGKGSGLPGAPENASVPAGTAGTPGWLGPTQAMGGRGYKAPSGIGGSLTFPQFPAPIAAGKHVSFPDLSLSITGAQVVPLPDDLRGTSGGAGGTCDDGYHIAPGSAGGSSGAGLLIICRGASFGAAGKITVDGNDGLLGKNWQGTYTTGFVGGSGGGSAPGAVLILLDGGASNYPDFNANTFSAKTGRTPKISYPRDYPGLYADPFDMSKSAYKIQYLPDIVTAENDPSRETVQP